MTIMRLKTACIIALAATAVAPSTAYSFSLTPTLHNSGRCARFNSIRSSDSGSSSVIDTRRSPVCSAALCSSATYSRRLVRTSDSRGTTWRSIRPSLGVRLMAATGKPDAPPARSDTGETTEGGQTGVSRALNRALGGFLSTGDMFGAVCGRNGERRKLLYVQVEQPGPGVLRVCRSVWVGWFVLVGFTSCFCLKI